MALPKLLPLALSLLLAAACSRQTRFERLEKQLDESYLQLQQLTTRVLDCYAAAPDEISVQFEDFCCDGTFEQIDSLVLQQRELLDSMADCCPRKLRRRMVLRVEQTCDLRRLADKAENPFIYKEFGPKLRHNCHSEEGGARRRTDARSESRGRLRTMPSKEEEDKR